MVSSDMPEVISMSDRVVVMKDGRGGGRDRQGPGHRGEHPHPLHRGQGRMSTQRGGTGTRRPALALQAPREPDGPRHLRAFVLVIAMLQLRLDAASAEVPHLHQPGEPAQHPPAGERPGDRRDRHDHGDDLRRHRPVGRHAGLAGVDRHRARHLASGATACRPSILLGVGTAVVLETVDGVHHLAGEGGALHHHAGRHDHLPGDRAPALQLARGGDEAASSTSSRPTSSPGPRTR